MTNQLDGTVVIVTAADQKYWRSLYQFLRSAELCGLFPRCRVIAYDLGLSTETRADLQRWFEFCEFRSFDFAVHPPHVAMARGTYAWKPIVIADLAEEFEDSLILWFDSATIFRSDLNEAFAEIRARGIHVLKGFDLLIESCNPLTLRALAEPLDIMYRRTRPANYVGIDARRDNARKLVRLWREHALIESHIAPPAPAGPWPRNRWGHKFDQSLLTILLYRMADAGEVVLTDEEVDMSSPRPVRWMITRNKVWPFMPRWADPPLRFYWNVCKVVDIGYRHVTQVCRTGLRGLHRMPGEHFTVFLGRGDGPAVAVPAPAMSYYADPMLWRQDGRLWLFVEELRYGEGCGRLCALPLDENLRSGAPVPILHGYLHAAYPFLTRIGEVLCLLPDTSSDRSLDLYVCERFPESWRLRRRILHDVDAADSTLLRHDGLWWLFTFVRAEPGREDRFLAIYFTDDPFAGEWREHPVNGERRYAEHRFNTMRSAGPFIVEEGRLLRPVQINPDYCGQSLGLMRIDRLTPQEFSEARFDEEHWASEPHLRDVHHISRAGDVTAWDTRDRIGIAGHLRRARRHRSIIEPDAV